MALALGVSAADGFKNKISTFRRVQERGIPDKWYLEGSTGGSANIDQKRPQQQETGTQRLPEKIL
jgi:hypothetical protein